MQDLVTVIIATQNNHRNLDRLLEYYNGTPFPIIIADTSNDKHRFRELAINWTYFHKPHVNRSAIIESALNLVLTPFVVICPDDHFVLTGGIKAGVDFLLKHPGYSAAQGYGINYPHETDPGKDIEFNLCESSASFDISMDDPLTRLKERFVHYRSLLYAVHRTSSLKLAFRNATFLVREHFLAELLAAVVPTVLGKYKELTVLYYVSESAKEKNKHDVRLQKLFSKSKRELDLFITLVAYNLSGSTGLNKDILRKQITDALNNMAGRDLIHEGESFDEGKTQNLLNQVSLIGRNVIRFKRRTQAELHCKKLLKAVEGSHDLMKVRAILVRSAEEKLPAATAF